MKPASHRIAHPEPAQWEAEEQVPHPLHSRNRRWVLPAITAIGVVYGDIGTSPLYAFQVALKATGHPVPLPSDIFGLVSLIFWGILLVVALKYVTVVMRADNEGEGGILALLSLVTAGRRLERLHFPILIALGVVGAAFIYGDGIITPAISVLSAIEGLNVAAPGLKHWVLALTIVVLIGLFAIQSRGTGKIGRLFGPIMIVWFLVIGLLGIMSILQAPTILKAINPAYAVEFLLHDGTTTFAVIGAAFLALTGAEALYADMGHVGPLAIRRAWFLLVLPALALSYFGQGALVLVNPAASVNPFFNQAPEWAALPLVLLATCATIIASQALISGAFSLTRQAMQMRLLPRFKISSTSGEHRGQIYIGVINWCLMIGAIAVVLAFRTSGNLAAAYGIAVSGTMLVTSILLFNIVRNTWKWPMAATIALIALFVAVDGVFLAANAAKFEEGGWFPLAVGGTLAFLMMVWRSGSIEVQHRLEEMSVPFDKFLEDLDERVVTRLPGCAVILTRAAPHATSPILVQQVRHNRVLHEDVILLTIKPIGRPIVHAKDRLEVTELGKGFHRVIARIGFMQTPDIQTYIKGCVRMGLECASDEVHYYVAYEHVARRPKRPYFPTVPWHVFNLMSKVGLRLTDFLDVPEKHVFEIGIKVPI